MGVITDLINLFNTVLTKLGFSEAYSENILSYAITILVFSWLNLTAYMLLRERKVLEHWKYPNLVVLGTTAIFGLSSFIVAYLTLVALILLITLSEPAEFINPPFFIIVTYMQMYMFIALIFFKKNIEQFPDTFIVPQGFIIIFRKTVEVVATLFFSIITLFLLHNALNTGLLNLGELTISQKATFWITSAIFACFTGLFGLYVRFGREEVNERIKHLKSKILKWCDRFRF